jgi:ferredoxin
VPAAGRRSGDRVVLDEGREPVEADAAVEDAANACPMIAIRMDG